MDVWTVKRESNHIRKIKSVFVQIICSNNYPRHMTRQMCHRLATHNFRGGKGDIS